MKEISGLVITLNEEKNIQACIESLLSVCCDVVVIDSYSNDNTVEVARAAGAKVIQQKFLGDGPQRSFGFKYCESDWILNLDADERLEEDAIQEISSLRLQDTDYDVFELRRKNMLHARWIKVAGWYPDNVKRLFNRTRTDFSQVFTHSAIVSKRSKRLHCHLIHYSFRDYTEMLDVLNRYATWQARSIVEERRKVNVTTPFTHGFFSFIKHYFIKRGFLGGLDGFVISFNAAVGSFFKYAKALELYNEEKNKNNT